MCSIALSLFCRETLSIAFVDRNELAIVRYQDHIALMKSYQSRHNQAMMMAVQLLPHLFSLLHVVTGFYSIFHSRNKIRDGKKEENGILTIG